MRVNIVPVYCQTVNNSQHLQSEGISDDRVSHNAAHLLTTVGSVHYENMPMYFFFFFFFFFFFSFFCNIQILDFS